MIKRFKQMHTGYFRLMVGLYVLAIPVVGLIAASAFRETKTSGYGRYVSQWTYSGSDEGIAAAVITVFAYWPLMRFCLWIYDGFKKEK